MISLLIYMAMIEVSAVVLMGLNLYSKIIHKIAALLSKD